MVYTAEVQEIPEEVYSNHLLPVLHIMDKFPENKEAQSQYELPTALIKLFVTKKNPVMLIILS